MPLDPQRMQRPVRPVAGGHLVLVANGARARLLSLAAPDVLLGEVTPLVEIGELVCPSTRQRDADLFTDSRPGLRREGPAGPRHAVSDRRDAHRREDARRFAGQIADRTVRAWRARRGAELVVAAAPTMLGLVRDALAVRLNADERARFRTHDHDLVRFSAPRIHARLAEAGHLPPRTRKPPLLPPQSPEPWPPPAE